LISRNKFSISSADARLTLWIVIRLLVSVCFKDRMSSSMAVRFVEYVNARWQPWAARSRAQAAPMLDFGYDQLGDM
jgi:hypothetical protein